METLLKDRPPSPPACTFIWLTLLSLSVYFYEILSLCHQFFPPWRDPGGQKILASGGLKGNQIISKVLVIDAMKMKGRKYKVRRSPPSRGSLEGAGREQGEGSVGVLRSLWEACGDSSRGKSERAGSSNRVTAFYAPGAWLKGLSSSRPPGGRGCVGSHQGSAGRRWWFHHWLLEVPLAHGGTDFPLVCPRMVEEELWFGFELGG